jgi:hypothetical protein
MNKNACKMGIKKKRTMNADEREAVDESTLPGTH